MKRKWSYALLGSVLACLSLGLSSCVDDGLSVKNIGVLDTSSGTCNQVDFKSSASLKNMGVLDYEIKQDYVLKIGLISNTSQTSPFGSKSSGGGGGASGAKFDTSNPQNNDVYIQGFDIQCVDKNNIFCKDSFQIVKRPLSAGSSAAFTVKIPVNITPDTLVPEGQQNVTYLISARYRNTFGVRDGKSNAVSFTVELCRNCLKTECDAKNATAPNQCDILGQDVKWKCEAKEKKEKEEDK